MAQARGWERERVVAAAIEKVDEGGAGLVESAPEVAGQDGLDGMVGVEVGGSEAVPDGVGRGPQEWSGDQPVASLTAVTGTFPGVPSWSGSASASIHPEGPPTARSQRGEPFWSCHRWGDVQRRERASMTDVLLFTAIVNVQGPLTRWSGGAPVFLSDWT